MPMPGDRFGNIIPNHKSLIHGPGADRQPRLMKKRPASVALRRGTLNGLGGGAAAASDERAGEPVETLAQGDQSEALLLFAEHEVYVGDRSKEFLVEHVGVRHMR